MFTGITSYEQLISIGILGNYLSNHEFQSIVPLAALYIGGFVVCAIIAYLLGSVNFGIILSGHLFGDDVRSHGSGNAGTTNMLRTYGKKAAVLTLAGDVLKSVVAVMIARLVLGSTCGYVAGLFAVLGHAFPIFYGFKGGKGVAATLGVALALNWAVALILSGVFLLLVASTKFVSLGSIIAAAFFPIVTDRMKGLVIPGAGQVPMIAPLITFLIAALVIWLHRSNLKRLFAGTESKLTFKKKDSPEGGTDDAK